MQKKYFTFFLTVLFCALGHITAELYLPSLPFIARKYGTSNNAAQFSLALFMLGFAFFQIVYGVISDKKGRKKPLIGGLSLALSGSFLCLFAPNIVFFNLGRLMQGSGIAAAVVLSRAILRDLFAGNVLVKFTSFFEISTNPLIILTPFLGGFLQKYWGCKSVFIVLVFYILAALFLTLFFFQETKPEISAKEIKSEKILKNILQILQNKTFLISALHIFLTYGAILAWLTFGPIILQDSVGLTSLQFGMASSLIGLAYIPAAFINAKLVHKFKLHHLLKFGSLWLILAGTLMAALAFLGLFNAAFIIVPVILLIVGAGFILPNCFAQAVAPFPEKAGLAAALLGMLQMLGGFFSSSLISIFSAKTAFPLAFVLLIYGLLAYLSVNYFTLREKEKI